jgi:D-galactose 1-dehydrogenase
MGIALVGIGKIARDQHIPAIHGSGSWSLAAAVSRNASVEDIDTYTDFHQMLAQRPDIRAVSLTMPPVPRFEYAMAALQSGRHVMLEKPPGATVSECQVLLETARENRVSLYATWHSRMAEMVPAAKIWLRGKKIKHLDIIWKEDVRQWHPNQDWIWQAGGLGVFDPGINALSIMTEILADPVHVTQAVLEIPENKDCPIAAELRFAHPHGAHVHAVFDWRQSGEQIWTIDIETDGGHLTLFDGGARMVVDGQAFASGDTPLHGEYPRLYAKFAELVSDAQSELDLSPLQHVADAFLIGRRVITDPYYES